MNSNNLAKDKILISFKQNKFKEVIVEGVKLYKQRQNDAQLIYILGLSSIKLENFEDAENYFNKLILLKKNSENLYILGNIQKKLQKFDHAIISFKGAIKLNPNFTGHIIT